MAATPLDSALGDWILHGYNAIGEISITPCGSSYQIHHQLDDPNDPTLELHRDPAAARQIALTDARGKYRPLKSAPTLRRAWKMVLADLPSLRRALDYFYPAALANFHHYQRGTLPITPLKSTLGRQTGMYRITQKLEHTQCQELVSQNCNSTNQCLKTILWPIAPGVNLKNLPPSKSDPVHDQLERERRVIPLLCPESCNLLVARGRTMAKASATSP